jgi:hypothetical protein
MLKRLRLLTFQIIVHFNDEETKENRIQLYEDFISIKNDIKFSIVQFLLIMLILILEIKEIDL